MNVLRATSRAAMTQMRQLRTLVPNTGNNNWRNLSLGQKRFLSNSSKNDGGKTTYRVVEQDSSYHSSSFGGGNGFRAQTGYSTVGGGVGGERVFITRNYFRKPFGYSIMGLFVVGCNIIYAACRAQDKPETGTIRLFTFLFGLPGSLFSFLLVREGSEVAYGIDLPKRPTVEAATRFATQLQLDQLEQRVHQQQQKRTATPTQDSRTVGSREIS